MTPKATASVIAPTWVFRVASGTLLLGADGHLDDHEATVTDPVNNPAFRVEAFNDVKA